MTVKEFLNNYTCAAGTLIHIYLPREAHAMTIVEAIETYGNSKVIGWRLSGVSSKRIIVIEINE